MPSQYFHANPDGTIEVSDPPSELTGREALTIIESAFSTYGHSFSWIDDSGQPYRTNVQVGKENKNIVFRVKSVSGGGRPDNIPKEQRIQITGEQLNELVEANFAGNIGLILGVYKRNGVSVIIAWRPMHKQTGGNVSKQANIQMIADAMFCGFAQFEYPTGNGVVCAFRPEFMQYYLLNVDVFSEKILSDHRDVITTQTDATDIPLDNRIKYKTGYQTDYERNRIVFGAPGTGKSFKLKKDCEDLLRETKGTFERVTFHPDYTYSNFVGTYKPVTELIAEDSGKTKSEIRYEFVPGPFIRVYVEALKSGSSQEPQPHLLLIEEINRAKVAAVFGDVFQLLDRDDSGVSEYEIHATEDIRNYLAKELGGVPNDFDRIRIPDNMFIWATMNSADQGVFPMDTAFKRRWNFEYIGINNNEGAIQRKIMLGRGTHRLEVDYNKLRKAINDKLAKDFKVNEDKLIGPFFLSMEVLKTIVAEDEVAEDEVAEYRVAEGKAIEYKVSEDKDVNLKKFTDAFKSKVIMYLYEDAAKQHKYKLFGGCDSSKYSSVCEAFDEIGIDIFGDGFRELYNQQGV